MSELFDFEWDGWSDVWVILLIVVAVSVFHAWINRKRDGR